FKPSPRGKPSNESPRVKPTKPTRVKPSKPTRVKPTKPTRVKPTKPTKLSKQEKNWQKFNVELDKIANKFRDMVAKAQTLRYHVGADNLKRFLDGTGGVKNLDVGWLRGYKVVVSAEKISHKKFETFLVKKAPKLNDGESITLDAEPVKHDLKATKFTDLYFALGKFSIKSNGSFKLTRTGNIVTIHGTVSHNLYDRYDWNKDAVTRVPGFGKVRQNDAILLQKYRGAKEFDIRAGWNQSVDGEIRIAPLRNKITYDWN
ncbi:MAG: hypothetical protein HZA82_06865, partial [Thaumarchaeota archaeon]|nr:hypothetical protein [Nitrososphaerota archaeon]